MSTRARLLLLIMPLVLLALGGVGGFALSQLHQFSLDIEQIQTGTHRISTAAEQSQQVVASALVDQANDDLELFINSLVTVFDERLSNLDQALSSNVHNSLLISYMNGGETLRARVYDGLLNNLNGLVESHSLSEASVIDPNGVELIRSEMIWVEAGKDPFFDGYPLPNKNVDESQSSWYLGHQNQKSSSISHYIYFDENVDPRFPMPVLSITTDLIYSGYRYLPEYGEFRGSLRLVIPIDRLLPELTLGNSGESAVIALVDAEGRVLVTNDQSDLIGSQWIMPDRARFHVIVRGFDDYALTLYLAVPTSHLDSTVQSIKELSSAIDTEIKTLADFSETTREKVRQTTGLFLVGCALMVIFICVGLVIIASHFTQPLAWLCDTTERIKQGDLDKPDEAPGSPSQEITVLAESIDAMRVRLKEHIEKLDDKVAEKTQALSDYTGRLEEEIEVRKQAEIAATKASEAKSSFLATMSHEIRTPMNGVIVMSEELLRTKLEGKQREMAEVVRLSGKHLLAIINDILDFSKLDAGKMKVIPESMNLRDVVKGVVELLSVSAKEKGIDIYYAWDDRITEFVMGDPVRINQILLNLAGNAVKFTDEGVVVIRVSLIEAQEQATSGEEDIFGDDKGERIRFEIKDTGVGVSEEQQKLLFKPFSQVDGSSTRQHGGTGLGLNICKHLVDLLSGVIGVESRDGQGSTFYVEIPYTSSEAPDKILSNDTRLDDADVQAAIKGLRVLLVEDNEINQMVAESLLEDYGFSFDIANNGAEAVEKFKDGTFDLILMDCQMPVMDGYEATRTIRALEAEDQSRRPVFIAAMTANALPEDRERCLAVGMNAFIAKPIDEKILHGAIHQAVVALS